MFAISLFIFWFQVQFGITICEYAPFEIRPPPKGYFISDPDLILSIWAFDSMNDWLLKSEHLEIKVLLIKKISSVFLKKYANREEEGAKEFALKVFDGWGMKNEKPENGVLIFMATVDNKLKMILGENIRNFLISTEGFNSSFREISNLFRQKTMTPDQTIKKIFILLQKSLDKKNQVRNQYIIIFLTSVSFAVFVRFIFVKFFSNKKEIEESPDKMKALKFIERKIKKFKGENCRICIEDFRAQKEIILACGHNFHKHCLETWLAEKNSCPICGLFDPTNPNNIDPFLKEYVESPFEKIREYGKRILRKISGNHIKVEY